MRVCPTCHCFPCVCSTDEQRETTSARLASEQGIGATGRYPEGAPHNEHDQGGIKIALRVEGDKVAIYFGKPVSWMVLTVAQALALADLLVQKAKGVP